MSIVFVMGKRPNIRMVWTVVTTENLQAVRLLVNINIFYTKRASLKKVSLLNKKLASINKLNIVMKLMCDANFEAVYCFT